MLLEGSEEVRQEDDLQGFEAVAPGRYHAIVQSVDDSFTKSQSSIIVELMVLAGTVPSEINKTHREFIATSGKAVKRAIKFGLAVGLVQPQQLGQRLDIDFQQAVGRQLIVDIEPHTYEKDGQKRNVSRVAFLGMHRPGHPDTAGVPLHPQMAAQIGIQVGPNGLPVGVGGNGGPPAPGGPATQQAAAQQPPRQPPQAPPAAGGQGSGWEDF